MEIFDLYVKAKGHLPCPADPTLTVDVVAFGFGNGTGAIGPGNCTANTLATDGATNVLMGMLPIQELALSPSDSVDGWGRRFSYVVDEDLTFSDTAPPPSGWADIDIDGQIQINTNGAAVTTEAAMVLISHGANGHGAWKGKGGATTLACETDADEKDNTDGTNASCTSFDNIFVKKFRSSTHDDLINYRLKWQFDTPS